MKQRSYIFIALALALAVGFFVIRSKAAKVAKVFRMAEFRVKNIEVGKMNGINIPVDVDIEIFNPSDFAVPVKNYKVEIYRRQADKNELLSTSETSSVDIPANGTVLNRVTFNLDAIHALKTAVDAVLNWDWTKIAADLKSELAKKVMIKIYANVYNQHIEREVNF